MWKLLVTLILSASAFAGGSGDYDHFIHYEIDYIEIPPDEEALRIVVETFARERILFAYTLEEVPSSSDYLDMATALIYQSMYKDFENSYYLLWGPSEDYTHGEAFIRGTMAFIRQAYRGNNPSARPESQAETLMHEIGHNLGLLHGGDVDERGYNYVSSMSYKYSRFIGYSHGCNGPDDYDDWGNLFFYYEQEPD